MMDGMDMMMQSPWHWDLFAALLLLILNSIGRMATRIGFSPFWTVLALVLHVNLIGSWRLARSAWPRDEGAPR